MKTNHQKIERNRSVRRKLTENHWVSAFVYAMSRFGWLSICDNLIWLLRCFFFWLCIFHLIHWALVKKSISYGADRQIAFSISTILHVSKSFRFVRDHTTSCKVHTKNLILCFQHETTHFLHYYYYIYVYVHLNGECGIKYSNINQMN